MGDMMKRRDPDYASKSDIKWNFTKFLVDRNGKVIARFEPTEDMIKVEQAVAAALK
jgi:glutathione peroxidase